MNQEKQRKEDVWCSYAEGRCEITRTHYHLSKPAGVEVVYDNGESKSFYVTPLKEEHEHQFRGDIRKDTPCIVCGYVFNSPTPKVADSLDQMVRDFTQVIPRSKSEVRRRISSEIERERARAEKEMSTELHQTLARAMRKENGKWIIEVGDELVDIFLESLTKTNHD